MPILISVCSLGVVGISVGDVVRLVLDRKYDLSFSEDVLE